MNQLEQKFSGETKVITGGVARVEQIGCALYAFGSELATLRLLKAYGMTDRTAQGYSQNLSAYFFRLELRVLAEAG